MRHEKQIEVFGVEVDKDKLWSDRLCDPETEWWGLLDTACELLRLCLNWGDKRVNAWNLTWRATFSRTAQEVKTYIAEDLTKHKSFTPAMRDSLIRDYGAYVERVWRWIEKSVKQGRPLKEEFGHLEHERLDFYHRIVPYLEGGHRTAKRGAPPKHTTGMITLAEKIYDEKYSETNDSRGAWSHAADIANFPSGEAARKAVERWRKKAKTE
ncbi:MAG: hypothetical protein CEE38_08475 [Planctomycetes bacterium B3_Pla]|nr:MAG: hypothetical protein CEE38_08475 [Planctomycetes bacterium B3_Pla]